MDRESVLLLLLMLIALIIAADLGWRFWQVAVPAPKGKLLFYKTDKASSLNQPAFPTEDAGADVASIADVLVPPFQVVAVALGLNIAPPPGTCFTFLTRSSAIKENLFVLPTLIDEGYRGPLYLFVINVGSEPKTIHCGDRVAQVMLLPNTLRDYDLVEVAKPELLPASLRGAKAFGSSGGTIRSIQ